MAHKIALRSGYGISTPPRGGQKTDRQGLLNEKEAFEDPYPPGRVLKPRAAVVVKSAGDGNLMLQAQLPGVRAVDIDLEIKDGTLTLRGERRKTGLRKTRGTDRRRQDYGLFRRTFALPAGVQQKEIDAVLQKGVLTIQIPTSGARSK